jgi:phage terminase large subunit
MYPNGSVLVVNGLDKPGKVKSWEFDLAFINEATEISVEDLEFVRSRLRNGVTPYQQVILDANPDAPTHWLNLRCNEGTTTRLLSRHEDNPRFHNGADWTQEGYQYIFETLGGLTGVRLLRLRYGVWAAAEGMVYMDAWSRERNLIDRIHIPKEWPRYLFVDFGYTNPFVCLWAARDPDGRLYVYREIYHTKRLVEDHCIDIAIAAGWWHLLPRTHERYRNNPAEWSDPLPRDIICDHDAEDRATFERHLGLYTTGAKKTVSDGIQAVASRLKPAGDGKPRLYYLRDSIVERDRDLAARKKPTCTVDEYDSYIWKETPTGIKEEPVKEDDHGLDASRYGVAYFDLVPNTVSTFKNIWW